jgi:hypothetical protein
LALPELSGPSWPSRLFQVCGRSSDVQAASLKVTADAPETSLLMNFQPGLTSTSARGVVGSV